MKKTVVGIIGPFADNSKYTGGQIVIAREFRNYFQNSVADIELVYVDTFALKKNIIALLKSLIVVLRKSDIYITILSSNGLRFFLPILYFFSTFGGKKIYCRIVGSSMGKDIVHHHKYIKYLNSFKKNYAEGSEQVKKLSSVGITNIKETTNMRSLPIMKNEDIYPYPKGLYKFCLYSRVNKQKGTTIAIQAVHEINKYYKQTIAKLDIYGIVDENYKDEFQKLLACCKNDVEYKGVADSQNSVKILTNYYMLLFPSTWEGEGISGTLVESLAAGLPVIASNWNMNSSVINDGFTGYIYNWKNKTELVEAIKKSIKNIDEVNDMRKNCLMEAKKYTSKSVMREILCDMDLKEKHTV